jgi:hypothetical protein
MMFFEIPFNDPTQEGELTILPIAGMNDKGLWYDLYLTPILLPENSSNKPYFTNSDYYYADNLAEYLLSEFSTISEYHNALLNYNLEVFAICNAFIIEPSGMSVILEGDNWIYKDGDFQVVSNFIPTRPDLGALGNGFERYNIAVSMLENMTDFSVEYFTDICNATHQEGYHPTVYSWICDLQNKIVYLYHYYDYDNVVVIDLEEELAKGEHYYSVGSLFEPDDNQEPGKPETPTGNESGKPGEIISFKCKKTSDPDGNPISYKWDWGDGTYSFWTPSSALGAYISSEHNWTEEGTYEVRVKARDVYGREGEWSDPLSVTMPRSINIFDTWFLRFIQRCPIFEFILK